MCGYSCARRHAYVYCVYLSVCMYVGMRVCTCMDGYVCECVYMRAFACACVHGILCGGVSVCVCTYKSNHD